MERTSSITETTLGIDGNRRDIRTQYSSVDGRVVRSNPNIVRSNVNPTGVPVGVRRDAGPSETPRTTVQVPVNPTVTDQPGSTLQPVTNQTASAGINWFIPVLIIGGFFAASKFKNKNKK